MKDNEVQKLVDIRAFLINRYNNLDGRANVGTAVMLQKDVAYMIETTIKKLDALLKDYVEIKKQY
jgi:hypothetical protein